MKFIDFVTLQRGFDLPKTNIVPGDVPVIGSTSIIGYHNVAKVSGPGVCTGRSGSLGTVQYIDKAFWPHNTSLWVKNFNGNDPRFVYYCMQSLDFGRFNAGAGVPTLNRNHLDSLSVNVPDLPSQRKIAGILSAYDDLIENNLRRIKILEEMAQSLYREWFVHFRFPGHESTKFIDSELGQIPKGWGVSDLEKVTTKIGSGATPRGGKESYKTDGIALIRSMNIYDYSFEFDNLAFIDLKQAAQLDNVSVEARDVLLNITGASVCRCAMVPSYLLPARVNQHVAIIRANTELVDPHFLPDSINSEQNKKTFFSLAQGGATREVLTKETICRFQILLPPRDLVFRYGRIAGAMHTQREGLHRKKQEPPPHPRPAAAEAAFQLMPTEIDSSVSVK